ncbi:MAG: MAE_28990/MAE_18760 family HEPN-like nuclease [Planctomycetota bacterium]
MQDVIDDFNERVSEVEQFLKVLERLEKPEVVLFDKSTRREKRVFQEGSLKVMKATVFLLIYNVVESSIRSAFAYLYDQIAVASITGTDLRAELRKIWISQQFQGLDDDSASVRTFRDLTERLVEEIANGKTVNLEGRLLPVSGNLDADSIRRVCKKHGVVVAVHRNASGGVEMKTVKDQRNSLAHGNSSFSECGKQYTVADLKRINNQAVVFVRGILRNVKKYTDKKLYVG